jgi:LPXTG-motif cell wall-anchored protein
MRMRKRRLENIKLAGILFLVVLLTFGSLMTSFAEVDSIESAGGEGPPAEVIDVEIVEGDEADFEGQEGEVEEPEGDLEEEPDLNESEMEEPIINKSAESSVETIGKPDLSITSPIEWEGHGSDSKKCEMAGEGPRDAKEGWIHWVANTKGDSTNAVLTLGGTGSGTYNPAEPLNAEVWHFFTPYYELDGLTATLTFSGAMNTPGKLVISDYCPGEPGAKIAIKKQTFIGDTNKLVKESVTFDFILKPLKGGDVIRIENVPANGMSEFIQIKPGKYLFKEVEKDGYVMDEWELVNLDETKSLSIMGNEHRWSGGWLDHRDRSWWGGRDERKPGYKPEHIIEILPNAKYRIDVTNRKIVEKELSKLSIKKVVMDGNDILNVEETFNVRLERLKDGDKVEFPIENGETITGNLEPGLYRLSEFNFPEGYRLREFKLTSKYGPDPWFKPDGDGILFKIPDKKTVHYKLLIVNERIPDDIKVDLLGLYKVVENVENDNTAFTIDWEKFEGEKGTHEVSETTPLLPEPIPAGLYRFRERAQAGYDFVRVELWIKVGNEFERIMEPTFDDGWLVLDLSKPKCDEYRIVFVNRVKPVVPPPPPPEEPRPPRPPRPEPRNGNGVQPVSVTPAPVPTAPPAPPFIPPVIPVLEEPVPLAPPVLPVTGDASPILFYMIGMLLAGAGFFTRKY